MGQNTILLTPAFTHKTSDPTFPTPAPFQASTPEHKAFISVCLSIKPLYMGKRKISSVCPSTKFSTILYFTELYGFHVV